MCEDDDEPRKLPVSIELLAIWFNHDPASATNDALNLRLNGLAGTLVGQPEWRVEGAGIVQVSAAAYAIEATRGRDLTIGVKLLSRSSGVQQVQVRAIDPAIAGTPGPADRISVLPAGHRAYRHTWLQYVAATRLGRTRSNVLGHVEPQLVTFYNDTATEFLSFALGDVRLATRGVGAWDVNWRWQYRLDDSSPWQDFAWTQHRIYALLDVPSRPWLQQPFVESNKQLPWAEVLERGCDWARHATSPDHAASRLTAAVYALGGSLVDYDCAGGGSTHYTRLIPQLSVDCTAFLDLLRGGMGNGRLVNCIDCASIVSTFANALGCELWQSGMFSDSGAPFALNPILTIGSHVWQTACNWGSFGYHEVAWKGGCTVQDTVFDACLLINGSSSPIHAPYLPLLPTNIVFGEPGQGLYRDRLAAPAGRLNCRPQPASTRRRRVVR